MAVQPASTAAIKANGAISQTIQSKDQTHKKQESCAINQDCAEMELCINIRVNTICKHSKLNHNQTMKPEIITNSGKMFDFVNPQPDQICIEDIAHALSNICRFTGHTKFFYSVAQHSILTSYIVPKSHQLAALLHDAAEAYINDIAKPLKQLLPDYAAIEERVERVIFAKFGVPYPLPDCVKRADLVMLATEQRDVLANGGEPWMVDVQPDSDCIVEWRFSRVKFLNRYHELKREIQA